ncbi:MAG: GtrA family protein [Mediterranea sp.]|jgi:putative flippase GtrA|nr:GtrA family protein [Mediterranea sp.]
MKFLTYRVDGTFVRFVLVGIVNTLFGVGLYCLFIYLGLPYRLAVLLSTVLGVLFNFKTIGAFVFRNRSNRLLFRFVGVYVVAYFVNIGIIHLLLLTTPLGEYWAGIVTTPVVAIVSYLLQKRFVFRH